MPSMLNIAIVEDNAALRDSLVDILISEGFRVLDFNDAEEFRIKCDASLLDILVLDLNLPGESGLSLSRSLRTEFPNLGILILTAHNAPSERTVGYENGADLYLTKPSTASELTSSIRALSRRLVRERNALISLVLNLKAMTLSGPAATVSLTSSEVALLEAFLRAPDNRLTVDFKDGSADTKSKATLGVKIVRLRKKLVAAGAIGQPINVVRHVGYQLGPTIKII